LNLDEARQTVIRVLVDVTKPARGAGAIGGGTTLAELGLRSLDLAEVIAVLEMEFDFDPFVGGANLAEVRTIDDLASLYLR
jgi:acyl carrier protein